MSDDKGISGPRDADRVNEDYEVPCWTEKWSITARYREARRHHGFKHRKGRFGSIRARRR